LSDFQTETELLTRVNNKFTTEIFGSLAVREREKNCGAFSKIAGGAGKIGVRSSWVEGQKLPRPCHL
jgi:hypothetical protein